MSAVRVLRGLVLGALGGLLGWCLVEPFPYLTSDEATTVDWTAIGLLAGIVGACIGTALGVAEGILAGTRPKFQRAVTLGGIVSFFGGWIGVWFGQALYSGILNTFQIRDQNPDNPFQFFLLLIARTLGWMFLGTLVGLSVGIPSLSARKVRHGFIGGMFGGALGGFSFETLARIGSVMPLFQGPVLRLIGFTAIGAATGFFVSLVAEAFKQAWVKVLVGRNEGREHVLDKPASVIGRDELAEIPVFGDASVARRHALIVQTNGRHILRDEGAPGGTQVNGQPVTQQLLQDGDQITVGRVTMIFYEKATATPYRRPVDVARSPAAPPPLTDANTCAYCGTARDPLTGACACTVSGDGPLGQPDSAGAGIGAPFGADAWSSPPTSFGSPRLVSLEGPYAGQQFPLRSGETSIGREPGRDVALVSDPTTSRRHAVIVQQNGSFLLRDEGSANGTFLNEMRVTTEQTLRPGDVVRFGSNRFRFEG